MTTPTIELLAVPAWNTPPRSLDDWRDALVAEGHAAVIRRDGGETWIELGELDLRGFVALDGEHVEAINFELHAPDPSPASQVVDAAAQRLGWEVHPDEPEEDDLDED